MKPITPNDLVKGSFEWACFQENSIEELQAVLKQQDEPNHWDMLEWSLTRRRMAS